MSRNVSRHISLSVCAMLTVATGCNLFTDTGPELRVVVEHEGGTGTVTSSPAGIDCRESCWAPFAHGSTVRLTAEPDQDSEFLGWAGACGGPSSTCDLTMNADRSVRARFGPATSLRVSKRGSGDGLVWSEPGGIFCGTVCEKTFTTGRDVTLTAEPDSRSAFTGWSGPCSHLGPVCTVRLSSAQEAIATFELGYSLSVSLTGSGTGTVLSTPPGIDCPGRCTASFASGTVVTLVVAADSASRFDYWSGGCAGSAAECSVTLTADQTVGAEFTRFHMLTLQTRGTGAGEILASGAGLTDEVCTGSCSYQLPHGTPITLEAEPAAGSTFAGWGAGCTAMERPCTVALSRDGTVNAYFTLGSAGIFKHISAGWHHSCAISETGHAYCWGSGGLGRLGDGTGGNRSAPSEVAGDLRWVNLDGGADHTCGVTGDGDGYCWGFHRESFTGVGNRVRLVPELVGVQWAHFSAGHEHTCGVKQIETGYCWGSNFAGAVGTGDQDFHYPSPTLIAGDRRWLVLSAGDAHTCGVTTGGLAVCWGQQLWGRLGNGNDTQAPVRQPTPLSGGPWTGISVGLYHSCGLRADGKALCWGRNAHGQLGTDSSADTSAPADVLSGETWVQLSAGGEHTCGLNAAGEAYCWGRGDNGQLGHGQQTGSLVPVQVAGGHAWVQLAAGREHTCGLTTENVAYCWGNGNSGQIGDGTTATRLIPTRVVNP